MSLVSGIKSSFGFKEWVLVCDALGRGEQSLLLRKGGIAEGAQGFGFEHEEFILFPTWFHAQVEKVRGASVLPARPDGQIRFEYAIKVEWSSRLSDFATVRRLGEFHVLQESVIEERFYYDRVQPSRTEEANVSQGIHVAFVRVFRLEPVVTIPMEEGFGGCKSWVELPDIMTSTMVSVISNEEHDRRKERFCGLLGVSF